MSRSNDIAGLTTSILDGVTATEVGLGNVDNTADSAKPVSTAQQSAIDGLGYQSVPHIIPGVLYPAVSGNDLSGTALGGSYVYGTAHTDGRKYYYTDIKGSKPIKDPRIGGHFGSQRHKFKSLQLLEQETATHGKEVFSIDGREWIRAVESFQAVNNAQGNYILGVDNAQGFVEIVGYFSDANMLVALRNNTNRGFTTHIDGGAVGGERTNFETSADTPLGSRYVDRSSLSNLALNQTLGVHTLKITDNANTDQLEFYGIELIAQDTTSTANRSKIQIPSQNVVSYGKKFTVSGTPHYNPFNGYTATSSFSSVVDVDTSLGLEAWKHTDNNYYPPVNGGRVVKWVDSSGTIKTSVTLMPPNATGIGSFSSNPRDPNYGSWSSQYQPTFKNETERQLHEVAKTFHFREFGNGSANGTITGSYPDASMLDAGTNRNIAFVMDDGLTSLTATNVQDQSYYGAMLPQTSDVYNYFTFIGTGIAVNNKSTNLGTIPFNQIAQNLPYGTHIFGISRNGSQSHSSLKIDGVVVDTDFNSGGYGSLTEVSFNQPKRPPIPEDACVLADYMLMADFVAKGATGVDKISKGIKACSVSRDLFYDSGSSVSFDHNPQDAAPFGFQAYHNHASSLYRIPSFSTGMGFNGASHTNRVDNAQFKLNGSNFSYNASNIYDLVGEWDDTNDDGTLDLRGSSQVAGTVFGVKNQTLGNNIYEVNNNSNTAYQLHTYIEAHNPIHTSSHYQSFETPFLHELVGGDRNMEQTNLVVSSDGKTWDEVTRDTSYIGKARLHTVPDGGHNGTSVNIFDEWRGTDGSYPSASFYNKDFAIAYDRAICLVDGCYHVTLLGFGTGTSDYVRLYINNIGASTFKIATANESGYVSWTGNLKRGDYLTSWSDMEQDNPPWGFFHIDRI